MNQWAAHFLVIVEADGSEIEVQVTRRELMDALNEDALIVIALETRAEIDALWRWREGVSFAVTAIHGGMVSEDIVVPVECLPEAVVEVAAIGDSHGVQTVNWGHAGDGNIHATFLVDLEHEGELRRADEAAHELFALARAFGGSASGAHGIGIAKVGQLEQQWDKAAIAAARAVKHALDPKGLFNLDKKLLR